MKQQLTNVGPTILSYLGIFLKKGDLYKIKVNYAKFSDSLRHNSVILVYLPI